MDTKDTVQFCPYCGAKVAEYGHDDDCGMADSDKALVLVPLNLTVKMRVRRKQQR